MTKQIDPALIEPGQEVEIALMRPQDAPGVAALFRAVYGEDYPVKTYYQPDGLRAANQSGDIISVVARTPKGDIVGHNATYRIAPCPKVYESGAGLVLPAYRNTAKLFQRMVAAGIQAAPDFGGEGIYGEHVCNHVYTQKVAAAMGNIIMGLAVDLMPTDAYKQEKSSQGRVSSVFGYQTQKPFAHTVHLPPVYADFMSYLYEGLAEPRRMEIADGKPAPGVLSDISGETYQFAGVTRITVRRIGEDFLPALGRWEAEATALGVVVYQVWLPMSQPCLGWAVDGLRERGYFMGGLLPRWFDEDGLLMQRLVHPPDWEAQQILLERSQSIARFIREDWERVAGGAR